MKIAVVRFPGSNGDADALNAAALAGHEAWFVWHRSKDLSGADAVILPGQLVRNGGLSFVCRTVTVRVESDATPFTSRYRVGQELRLPVAHGDGRYVADEATLDRLERERRVVFRYVGGNPNGAMRDIAGVASEEGNVVGMMPHPERSVEAILGSRDGLALFGFAEVPAAVS